MIHLMMIHLLMIKLINDPIAVIGTEDFSSRKKIEDMIKVIF